MPPRNGTAWGIALARSAAPEVAEIARQLAQSRDVIASAAAAHLKALAGLAVAVHEHNAMLSQYRDRLASLGLLVGEDFSEGALPDGVLTQGVTWLPMPCEGVVTSALHQVFRSRGRGNPFSMIDSRYWLPSQVAQRPDGLTPPTLSDVGAVVPRRPELPAARMAEPLPGNEAARVATLARSSR